MRTRRRDKRRGKEEQGGRQREARRENGSIARLLVIGCILLYSDRG